MIRHRVLLVFALLYSAGAMAQPTGAARSPAMDHSAHGARSSASAALPKEPGQSAFAAIQEIVELLEADPSTDWSKVNIEGLRRHLTDMNNVTLFAKVRSETIDGGARFTVTGVADVRDSIRRMVLGHAGTMNGVGGVKFSAKEIADGVVLSVTAANAREVAKLRGLGFIGAMTRGMHHQSHHLAIASGRGPHE